MIPNIYQDQPLQVNSCLEVFERFVRPFESSITRKEIWDNFNKLLSYIDNYNYLKYVNCMYLDGEFISQSANPDILNILIKFDFELLLAEHGDLSEFGKWEEDLEQLSEILFKRVTLTTAFCNIDLTNPNYVKIHEFSEQIIQLNVDLYTTVPNEPNRSKIYLILNNFDL